VSGNAIRVKKRSQFATLPLDCNWLEIQDTLRIAVAKERMRAAKTKPICAAGGERAWHHRSGKNEANLRGSPEKNARHQAFTAACSRRKK